MSCKAKEHQDVTRCNKCQKFGHSAAFCRTEKEVCGWCSKMGHKKDECPERDRAPKCANCGGRFSANHKKCKGKVTAILSVAKRTDYGRKDRTGGEEQP